MVYMLYTYMLCNVTFIPEPQAKKITSAICWRPNLLAIHHGPDHPKYKYKYKHKYKYIYKYKHKYKYNKPIQISQPPEPLIDWVEPSKGVSLCGERLKCSDRS